MPPKQVVFSSGRPQKGFIGTAYDEITHPENTTIVRSLLVFGAGVAFLHSSLGELLLPP
ncbi:putative TOM core complex subunit Tom6 [Aspergillus steynii IBT 23096]|uniref:Putative TOM core complex subunit Tom6 n=1 Tax=Aspergillus steynii IBT 23096 TaxID=1392250 RepID=A0A2I2G9R6_9EURO|nr:putative TOM core complex subunit Tom6 [Aspergillus steynii IBT 23096]PLB49622.1 putative TOM core complex subunit Tom6 [Aspergillus steynii IBT 23096]